MFYLGISWHTKCIQNKFRGSSDKFKFGRCFVLCSWSSSIFSLHHLFVRITSDSNVHSTTCYRDFKAATSFGLGVCQGIIWLQVNKVSFPSRSTVFLSDFLCYDPKQISRIQHSAQWPGDQGRLKVVRVTCGRDGWWGSPSSGGLFHPGMAIEFFRCSRPEK